MKLILSSLTICIAATFLATSSQLTSQLSSLLNQLPLLHLIHPLSNDTIFSPSSNPIFPGLVFTPPSFFASQKPANMSTPRAIRQAFLAVEQSEGAGARVRRSIGTSKLRNFSPFLMLDHFSVSPGAGFPDHPHRGQGKFPLFHCFYLLLTKTRDDYVSSQWRCRPRGLCREQRDH